MKISNYIKSLLPIFLIILLIPKILVLSGCANIVPPTGGPRDTLPPRLVKAAPPDSSTIFKSKTITFTFDEFVKVENLQENILISPTPDAQPLVEAKLRTVTVKLKDTLEPGTTYIYNFGNAIKDINESNVLRNFTYIFSTGTALDSLELQGRVLLAETGGIDSTLIVMLHRNGDDSAVVKEKPRYISRLDGKGHFHFRFLPAGTFYLYALQDEGGSKRYMSGSQLFAFSDSAVEIKPGVANQTLYAYAEKKEQAAPTISFGATRSGRGGGDDRRLRFSTNLNNNVQDLLNQFMLNFEHPLRNFDTSMLQLSTDSVFKKETNYKWETDSLKKKLTLQIAWKENTRYNLILDRDFAEDTSGRKLFKTDTLSFITRKSSDYGSVKIIFTKLDLTKNPVLQIIQGSQVVKSVPVTVAGVFLPLFLPGEYDLRILVDENKNGQWDAGEFFGKHKQPEIVIPLNKKITVRANWDNELEIGF